MMRAASYRLARTATSPGGPGRVPPGTQGRDRAAERMSGTALPSCWRLHPALAPHLPAEDTAPRPPLFRGIPLTDDARAWRTVRRALTVLRAFLPRQYGLR